MISPTDSVDLDDFPIGDDFSSDTSQPRLPKSTVESVIADLRDAEEQQRAEEAVFAQLKAELQE